VDLKEKVKERIDGLSNELQELITEREDIHERINDINVRIAHIVGAIEELDKLSREENV
jgi:chaperonin cofactor prefoldin